MRPFLRFNKLYLRLIIITWLFLTFGIYLTENKSQIRAQNLQSSSASPDSTQSIVAAPAQFNAVRSEIKQKTDTGQLPSFVVVVSKKGEIIWEEAFGWADPERKIMATPQTIYPLASTSKSITATALMTLVEKGKVKLDDPAEKYLGDAKLTFYRGNSSDLKVRDLLNMTGGIPHYWQYYYPEDAGRRISLSEQIRRYGIVVAAPGKTFNYSNFSPSIVEQIILQVTGKNLDEYARTELFAPLGMKNSFLGYHPAFQEQIATGYDFQNKPTTHTDFQPYGGAGFFSSADDLMRYAMLHLKDDKGASSRILGSKTIDALHQKPAADAPNRGYVNGWGYIEIGDYHVLLSNGSIMGANSSVMLIPSEDVAIVCLTNGSKNEGFTDQIAFEITDVFKPGFNEKFTKIIADAEAKESGTEYKPSPQFTGIWEGKIKTYAGEVPITMNFDSNGKVYVKVKGQMETLLNDIKLFDDKLKGRFAGNISTDDALSKCHRIDLEVTVEGNEMYGVARAFSTVSKPSFGLPSYIVLNKK